MGWQVLTDPDPAILQNAELALVISGDKLDSAWWLWLSERRSKADVCSVVRAVNGSAQLLLFLAIVSAIEDVLLGFVSRCILNKYLNELSKQRAAL